MAGHIVVGELKKRVDTPFKESQLKRLSLDELIYVAKNYKSHGLSTALRNHILGK